MKLLAKIEKQLQFLLGILFMFFFLRLPSLFEPYWYGDEGIYQAMANGINNGRILFSEVWDNKPPLLYLLYALYNGNQFSLRLLSLVFGLASTVVLFFLASKLFKKQQAIYVTTGFFAILFALPTIEGNIANAENFFILPVVTAMYVIVTYITKYQSRSRIENASVKSVAKTLFIPGFLFGISFLIKIVTFFDFLAAIILLLIISLPSTKSFPEWIKHVWSECKKLSYLLLGFLLPFLLSLVYFVSQGAVSEYLSASFLGNITYVGYNNQLVIPQGLLLVKLLFLFLSIATLFRLRKTLPVSLFIVLIWLSFSLFNTLFAQRPYPHYLLALLPAFSLLLGSIVEFSQYKKYLFILTGSVLLVVIYGFNILHYRNPLFYYTNFLRYEMGVLSKQAYFDYFDRNTNNWYAISEYVKSHTNPNDIVFLWGNSPQIYHLSQTLPPGRYVVGYHIAYNKKAEDETSLAMKKNPPKIIMISDDIPYYPFSLVGYRYNATIASTDIYEKIH